MAGLVLIASLAYVCWYIHASSQEPYNWDEVDYLKASQLGFKANYLEENSLSILQFYKLGKLKQLGDTNALQQYAINLPPEKTDPFKLRHFHPPLPNYFWAFCKRFMTSDSGWRYTSIVMVILFCFFFFGSLHLSRSLDASKLLIACTGLALLLISSISQVSLSTIGYHVPHALACWFFTAAFIRQYEEPVRKNNFILGIAAAFLLLTLEMGLAVLALALLNVLLQKKIKYYLQREFLLFVLAGFVLTMLLFWPGFFLKGGSFKSLMMYAYRILIRSNDEYQHVSATGIWWAFFRENVFLAIWMGYGLLYSVFLLLRRQLSEKGKITLLIGLGYSFIITPFAIAETYLFPAVAILCLLTVLVLMQESEKKFVLPYAVFGFGFLTILVQFARTDFNSIETRVNKKAELFRQDLQKISQYHDSEGRTLVTGAKLLELYLPQYQFEDAERYSFFDTTLYERKNYAYRSLEKELRQKVYNTIVIQKLLRYPEQTIKRIEDMGYRRERLNEFDLLILEKDTVTESSHPGR
jgi:hypothetical protein